jgi:hypothetical protein
VRRGKRGEVEKVMTGCENRFQWHLVSSSSHGSQSEPSSSPTAAGSWWASSALPVITPLAYKRGAGRWRRGEEERRGGEGGEGEGRRRGRYTSSNTSI